MTLTRFANAASKPIHSTWATGNHMITKTNIAQLLARNVDEIQPPEWRAVVDQAVRVLANATPAEQQIGVAKLADRYGPEAANEAERLFAAQRRAKVMQTAMRAEPAVVLNPAPWFNLEPKPTPQPEPRPASVSEPIDAALARLNPIEDWPEWLASAVAEAQADSTLRDGLRDYADRWGEGGSEEFDAELAAAEDESRRGRVAV
jgi:hypothetical protein